MIISLCTVLFNINGNVILDASNDSDIKFLSRRISRVATLDGGCVIIDNGFTPSDGVIKVIIDPQNNTLALYQQLSAIIKQYGLVTVSAQDGVFLAAIESISNPGSKLSINLLIKSQLA